MTCLFVLFYSFFSKNLDLFFDLCYYNIMLNKNLKKGELLSAFVAKKIMI